MTLWNHYTYMTFVHPPCEWKNNRERNSWHKCIHRVICMLNHSTALPFATHKFHLSILHHEQKETRRRNFVCVCEWFMEIFILQNIFLFSRVVRHFETLQKWKLFLTFLKRFSYFYHAMLLLRWEFTSLRILCDGIINIIIAFVVKGIQHFLLLSPTFFWERFYAIPLHFSFFYAHSTLYSPARYERTVEVVGVIALLFFRGLK